MGMVYLIDEGITCYIILSLRPGVPTVYMTCRAMSDAFERAPAICALRSSWSVVIGPRYVHGSPGRMTGTRLLVICNGSRRALLG